MTTDRVIACLDVQGGRVVKGVQFLDLVDRGDPAELAARYEADGADEIVFLDVSATTEQRSLLLETVQRTAERLFIPLTVGGGISTKDEVNLALRAGADKVSLNSAIVARPELLTEAAAAIGSQSVVASIDAKWDGTTYRVFTHGGRRPTDLEAISWAQECALRGAGEILLTAINNDGGRQGYDLTLIRKVSEAVDIPVVASGGAGNAEHLLAAFVEGGAQAALVAGILHDGTTTVHALKDSLRHAGRTVRSQPV